MARVRNQQRLLPTPVSSRRKEQNSARRVEQIPVSADQRPDLPVRCEHPNPVVVGVGDIDRPVSPDRHPDRSVEGRLSPTPIGLSPGAGLPRQRLPRACCRVDADDRVRPRVRDDQSPLSRVDSDAGGCLQPGAESNCRSIRGNPVDRARHALRVVDRSLVIDRDAEWLVGRTPRSLRRTGYAQGRDSPGNRWAPSFPHLFPAPPRLPELEKDDSHSSCHHQEDQSFAHNAQSTPKSRIARRLQAPATPPTRAFAKSIMIDASWQNIPETDI